MQSSRNKVIRNTRFFYMQRFFFNSASVYFMNWTSNVVKCCLNITIIILRHILYFVYLGPCLDLGLFMSYLCDLFFVLSLIFHLVFVYFKNISYCFWMTMWIKKMNYFPIAKVQSQGVASLLLNVFVNFNLTLLIKLLLIKKAFSATLHYAGSQSKIFNHKMSRKTKMNLLKQWKKPASSR